MTKSNSKSHEHQHFAPAHTHFSYTFFPCSMEMQLGERWKLYHICLNLQMLSSVTFTKNQITCIQRNVCSIYLAYALPLYSGYAIKPWCFPALLVRCYCCFGNRHVYKLPQQMSFFCSASYCYIDNERTRIHRASTKRSTTQNQANYRSRFCCCKCVNIMNNFHRNKTFFTPLMIPPFEPMPNLCWRIKHSMSKVKSN